MMALRAPVSSRTAGVVSTRRAAKPASRSAAVRVVRANAEPEKQPEVIKPHSTAPKVSTFEEVMGFAGAAPEIVNGRLAQLGFLAAIGAELTTHERVTEQLSGAFGPIAATFALFAAASLVPIFKGVKNDESFGPFTPKAEMTNGRLAMLGFALLIGIEAFKGSALL